MARALIVGAQHTDQDRRVLQRFEAAAKSAGHEATLWMPAGDDALARLRSAVQSHDACIALLDGHPLDPSLVWSIGAAHVARRPILGLRSDARADVPPEVRAALKDLVTVPGWDAPEAATGIGAFLGSVRVFAGALVRDAVPKLLKDQGQDLKFRQVAAPEYPAVLKRKIVETAQRLEETEFGPEQEEIADVLELLETLINLRQYDRESLRSIKEGKWRKRGGYQKGYLLEDEPVLSSR